MKKFCPKCEKFKQLKSFSKNRGLKSGLQSWCKKCVNINSKKYRATPKINRERHMKHLYGITSKQYNKMLKKQNGVCIICGGINPDKRPLFVDHNHKTGKIRGLLCRKCNTYLGLVEHLEFFNKLLAYLEKYND